MKTYCPNTKPSYRFTRPITKSGKITEYFQLLVSMYNGRILSSVEPYNMRMFITVQNLRMAGLILFEESEYVISEEGCDYVITHLCENNMMNKLK